MDGEEHVMAQRVIAEANTSLVVRALEESIEELRGEIEFLKEENLRLRNVSRATRMTSRNVRRDVAILLTQVEDMGKHIMDIAAEEAAQESDTTPIPETTT
jgi:ribosomal protein L29